MKKKYEESFTECPVCRNPVMIKNLPRHLSKVHPTDTMVEGEKKDEEIYLSENIRMIRNELRAHRRLRNIASILFVTMIVLLPIAYAITLPTEKIFTSQSENSNSQISSQDSQSSNQDSQSSNSDRELVSATDFSSVDVVTGETFLLSQLKGSIVVLNFVNYGCNAKTNEIVSDQLLDIKSIRAQRDDFTPVSVFCGCCPVETLRDFAVENELTWPWILDSDYSIIRMYVDYVREYGYPTLIFINKDQNIYDYGGYFNTEALSTIIDEML